MGDYKQVERELTQDAQTVDRLLGIIRNEKKKVPASISEKVTSETRLKTAQEELLEIVGLQEFNRLMAEMNSRDR